MLRRRLIAIAVGSAVFLGPAVPQQTVAEPVTRAVTQQVSTRAIPAAPIRVAVAPRTIIRVLPVNLKVPRNLRGYPMRKYFAFHYIWLKYHWGHIQFSCLNKLWTKESNWGIKIPRPSGPGGIPQALPATKMKRFGNMYKYRVQIVWGSWYIKNRYGNSCSAWRHWQRHNWY